MVKQLRWFVVCQISAKKRTNETKTETIFRIVIHFHTHTRTPANQIESESVHANSRFGSLFFHSLWHYYLVWFRYTCVCVCVELRQWLADYMFYWFPDLVASETTRSLETEPATESETKTNETREISVQEQQNKIPTAACNNKITITSPLPGNANRKTFPYPRL